MEMGGPNSQSGPLRVLVNVATPAQPHGTQQHVMVIDLACICSLENDNPSSRITYKQRL